MDIIVVGCGRIGSDLAYRLYQKGHKVAVVDHRVSAFNNLHPNFRGRTVEGEVLNHGTLHRAGIEQADGLAAVTNTDSLNAVVAHIARTEYKLPNVVVRNFDAKWRALLEAFDLQVVSSASWGAQRLEELLYHQELRTVFSAGNGEVELYEFTVPAAWDGRTLKDLLPDNECALAALTRAGRAVLPDRAMPIQAGDVILVSATLNGIQSLRSKLNLRREA